jgi:hypothetical protein
VKRPESPVDPADRQRHMNQPCRRSSSRAPRKGGSSRPGGQRRSRSSTESSGSIRATCRRSRYGSSEPIAAHHEFMVLGQLALMSTPSPSPPAHSASTSLRPKGDAINGPGGGPRAATLRPWRRRDWACAHERSTPNEVSVDPSRRRAARSGFISSGRFSRTWSRRATGSSAPSLGRWSRMPP